MSVEIVKKSDIKSTELSLIEQVVLQGDLSKLTAEQRVIYYNKVCDSLGLNPYTGPFAYISLSGKLTLYAKKDATDQLRDVKKISIIDLEAQMVDDLYIVKAKASNQYGRTDESTGAVTMGHLKGEAKANAMMKAETKAKRRVTLSICGLGWVDESEIDSIPNARKVEVDLNTGEIKKELTTVNLKNEQIEIKNDKLSPKQVEEIKMILEECDDKFKEWFYKVIKGHHKAKDIEDLSSIFFEDMKAACTKNMLENHEKQKKKFEEVQVLEQVQ